MDALREAGVKIINIDTEVKDLNLVDAYVGTDNKQAGYLCGEDVVQRFPEGGKVLILECPNTNSINERITGFEEAIADQGFEIVARENVNGSKEISMETTKRLLKQYPDVPVYTAEYELLVKLTGFALTRGMLCAMRRNPLPSVEEICRNAKPHSSS